MNSKHRRAAYAVALTAATMTIVPAGQAAATGHQLTGIVHTSETWPTDPTPRKTVAKDCPASTYLVGAGFSSGDFGGNVRIEDVIPTAQGLTVTAEVDEDGPQNTSWALTAHLVCANQPPGHEIVERTSVATSGYKTGVSPCDDDKEALGAGFRLPDTNGQLSVTGVHLASDLTSTTVYEDDTGYGSSWSIVTYAICAYPIDGWELTPEADSDSGTQGQYEPSWCPEGKVALSAAGHFDGGDGNVFLSRLSAFLLPQFDDASGTSTHGNDDDNGTSLGHNMYGVALCVNL
jgi:hypothetical protein